MKIKSLIKFYNDDLVVKELFNKDEVCCLQVKLQKIPEKCWSKMC